MKKTAKRSIIVSAVLAIIMCVSLVAGATFALFTSDSKVNISVSSGKVKVEATVEGFQTYSGKDLTGNAEEDAKNRIHKTDDSTYFTGGKNGVFYNSGTAELNTDKNYLTIDRMTPGDKVTFDVKITNKSNVSAKYRTLIACEEDDGLFKGLKISITDNEVTTQWSNGFSAVSAYSDLSATNDASGSEVKTVNVSIELPSDADNTYQDKNCTILYVVEAIQGNAATDELDENTLYLYNAHDLFAFANAVNTNDTDVLDAYTNGAKLVANIDLKNAAWTPIGQKNSTIKFTKTFDGANYTVYGLNVTADSLTSAHDGYGAFFGAIDGDAVVKNLTVSGTASCENAAGVVARMHKGTIENCTSEVTVTGTSKAGGIVCLTNENGCTIKGCTNSGNISIGNVSGETNSAGGIVAYANASTKITDCVNKAMTVSSASDERGYCGGIVGYFSGKTGNAITNCKNSASITGSTAAGGIVGIATDQIVITDCENSGAVASNNVNCAAGGIIGSCLNGTLTACKNTNTVSGKHAGGVVGQTTGTTSVIDSCSGGTATISGTNFGRLIGKVCYAKLTIDDENGDSYDGIAAIGYADGTSQGNTKDKSVYIVSGTLHGNILGGQRAADQADKTHVIINTGASWEVDGAQRTGTWYPTGDNGEWAQEQ